MNAEQNSLEYAAVVSHASANDAQQRGAPLPESFEIRWHQNRRNAPDQNHVKVMENQVMES
jgi:hypothetical protein